MFSIFGRKSRAERRVGMLEIAGTT